jgi:hypothetical protein
MPLNDFVEGILPVVGAMVVVERMVVLGTTTTVLQVKNMLDPRVVVEMAMVVGIMAIVLRVKNVLDPRVVLD